LRIRRGNTPRRLTTNKKVGFRPPSAFAKISIALPADKMQGGIAAVTRSLVAPTSSPCAVTAKMAAPHQSESERVGQRKHAPDLRYNLPRDSPKAWTTFSPRPAVPAAHRRGLGGQAR
jgi:hypothetical protein